MGDFTDIFFYFIGASAIESMEKSRIFRYGSPEDILSKGQKTILKQMLVLSKTS